MWNWEVEQKFWVKFKLSTFLLYSQFWSHLNFWMLKQIFIPYQSDQYLSHRHPARKFIVWNSYFFFKNQSTMVFRPWNRFRLATYAITKKQLFFISFFTTVGRTSNYRFIRDENKEQKIALTSKDKRERQKTKNIL